MSPHEYRILFLVLGALVIFWGSIVTYQEFAHPAVRATESSEILTNLALPKTTSNFQLTYAKDHEREWLDANSGDRAKALPAWSKILNNFRLNVVGSGEQAAKDGLKDSEAWCGKITGDTTLDSRIIEAAVMTNLYSEGKVWSQINQKLEQAASNEEIDKTLSENKF